MMIPKHCFTTRKHSMISLQSGLVDPPSKSLYSDNGIPMLKRNEICIGKLLGKGDFAKVYKVSKFISSQVHLVSNDGNDELNDKNKLRRCTSSNQLQRSNGTNSSNSRRRLLPRRSSTSEAIMTSQTKPKRSKTIKKKFAIKQLKTSILHDSRGEEFAISAAIDFVAEAQILAGLNHENIVKLHGVSCFNGQAKDFFIIIDQVEETLNDKIMRWKKIKAIQQSSSFFVQKINIVMQIADALQYIHDCGLIYRDLKPQNIGLTTATNTNDSEESPITAVKLFDFGLCRRLPAVDSTDDEQKKSGDEDPLFHMSIAGSQRYMPPEMLLNDRYNAKADVYSWAIVFYEMLSLYKPYRRYDADQHKIFVAEYGVRPNLSDLNLHKDLKLLFFYSWHQDISERYNIKSVRIKLNEVLQTFFKNAPLKENDETKNHTNRERRRGAKMNSDTDSLDFTSLCSMD